MIFIRVSSYILLIWLSCLWSISFDFCRADMKLDRPFVLFILPTPESSFGIPKLSKASVIWVYRDQLNPAQNFFRPVSIPAHVYPHTCKLNDSVYILATIVADQFGLVKR